MWTNLDPLRDPPLGPKDAQSRTHSPFRESRHFRDALRANERLQCGPVHALCQRHSDNGCSSGARPLFRQYRLPVLIEVATRLRARRVSPCYTFRAVSSRTGVTWR